MLRVGAKGLGEIVHLFANYLFPKEKWPLSSGQEAVLYLEPDALSRQAPTPWEIKMGCCPHPRPSHVTFQRDGSRPLRKTVLA